MKNGEPHNSDRPATKADFDNALAATKGEFKELFTAHKADMEQLLADQANVILEAVDEKLDKKLGEKFDPVITKLDGILKGVEALQQENVAGAEQLRRHVDQLRDHEDRIKALELQPQH
jgi:DNA repair exonuclease SbcCD ATPase subunit